MDNRERLQKYLARCGVASRRHVEELIRDSKVAVNGQVVTKMGLMVDPDKDRVAVEGKGVKPNKERAYFLLYKPSGVVSSCKDPQNRKTVLDFIPAKERLFPIGRLDYQTEGLLLLTDDGELANRLTHPRYKIPKTYLVIAEGLLTDGKAAALQKGIALEDGLTQPAKLAVDYAGPRKARFSLTITEGRNRQVRRMCEAIGLEVTYLCRTKMGFLDLQGLKPGGFRRLNTGEIKQLQHYAGKGGDSV